MVTLTDVDEDDGKNLCTIIVSLMQKDARLKRIESGGEDSSESIQFRLYKVCLI